MDIFIKYIFNIIDKFIWINRILDIAGISDIININVNINNIKRLLTPQVNVLI